MARWIRVFNTESALVPFLSILMGLVVGGLIMLIGGFNPVNAYVSLLQKAVGSPYDIGETIREITPLILTGLSVAFAFRTGLFNIGAEGQMILGMVGAAWIGIKVELPAFLHAPLAIITGAILGGLWGAIAGWLKSARGVNEVITTIMLNWVALYLSNYIVGHFLQEPGQMRSRYIRETASIQWGFLSGILQGARVHYGVILALLMAAVVYILLWKTRQGFELRAVGINPHAAHYAGMNVNGNVVKAMFIGGVLAGLAGAFEVLGVFGYQSIEAASTGRGFDGIAVSLLGGNHPLGVILGAILFGSLTYGSAGMSFGADVPPEIIRVIIGLVIFFVASHGMVRWVFKPLFRNRKKEGAVG